MSQSSSEEIRVIPCETLLLSADALQHRDLQGTSLQVAANLNPLPVSSLYPSASVPTESPAQSSRSSPFNLPPGGVYAATRKLQQELEALRAMKSARLAEVAHPGQLPQDHGETEGEMNGLSASISQSETKTSAGGTKQQHQQHQQQAKFGAAGSQDLPGSNLSPGAVQGLTSHAPTSMHGSAGSGDAAQAGCADGPTHSASTTAAPVRLLASEIEPCDDAPGPDQHSDPPTTSSHIAPQMHGQGGVVQGATRNHSLLPASTNTANCQPCGAALPRAASAAVASQGLSHGSQPSSTGAGRAVGGAGAPGEDALPQDISYTEWSRLADADPCSMGPAAADAGDASEVGDTSYEQWCKDSELRAADRLSTGQAASVPAPAPLPAAPTPPAAPVIESGGAGPRFSLQQPQPAVVESEDSYAPVLTLNPLPGGARTSMCLPSYPEHATATTLRGVPAPAAAVADSPRLPAPSLPTTKAPPSSLAAAGGPQRSLLRTASACSPAEARAARKVTGVRFAQEEASSSDGTDDSGEEIVSSSRTPTLLFVRVSRTTPQSDSEGLGSPSRKASVSSLTHRLQHQSKSDFSRDSLSSNGAGTDAPGSAATKGKETSKGRSSPHNFHHHRKSISDVMRSITHMGRSSLHKSAATETFNRQSLQAGEVTYFSSEQASSTTSKNSHESDEVSEASSLATGATNTNLEDVSDKGKSEKKTEDKKKKKKKKKKPAASRLVQHSRQSMDALRSALHIGGHGSSSGQHHVHKPSLLSRSMANIGALMHSNDSLKKELENVQDAPVFNSSRPRPRASIDTFKAKAMSGGKKLMLARRSVELNALAGRQPSIYEDLDNIGVVAPVPEPEHEAGLLLPPCPPLRYSVDLSGTLAMHSGHTRARTSGATSPPGPGSLSSRGSLALPQLSEELPSPGFVQQGPPSSKDRAPVSPRQLSGPQVLAAVPAPRSSSISSPQISASALSSCDAPSALAAAVSSTAPQRLSLAANPGPSMVFGSGLYAQRPDPAALRAAARAVAAGRISDSMARSLTSPGISKAVGGGSGRYSDGGRHIVTSPRNSKADKGVVEQEDSNARNGAIGTGSAQGAQEAAHAALALPAPAAVLAGPACLDKGELWKQQEQQEHVLDRVKRAVLGRAHTSDLHSSPTGSAADSTEGGPMRRRSLSLPQPATAAARAAMKLGCRRPSRSRSPSSARTDPESCSGFLALEMSQLPNSTALSGPHSFTALPSRHARGGRRREAFARWSLPEDLVKRPLQHTSQMVALPHASQMVAQALTTEVGDGGPEPGPKELFLLQEEDRQQQQQPLPGVRRNPLFRNVDSAASRDSQPSSPISPYQAVQPFEHPPKAPQDGSQEHSGTENAPKDPSTPPPTNSSRIPSAPQSEPLHGPHLPQAPPATVSRIPSSVNEATRPQGTQPSSPLSDVTLPPPPALASAHLAHAPAEGGPPIFKRSLTQAQTHATVQLLLAKLAALPQELRAQIAKELSQGSESACLDRHMQHAKLMATPPAAAAPPPPPITTTTAAAVATTTSKPGTPQTAAHTAAQPPTAETLASEEPTPPTVTVVGPTTSSAAVPTELQAAKGAAAMRPAVDVAAVEPDTTVAAGKPAAGAAAEQPEADMVAVQPDACLAAEQPEASVAAVQPDAGMEAERPEASVAAVKPGADTVAVQLDAGVVAVQPGAGAATEQPEAGAATVQPPAGTVAEQPAAGMVAVQPGADTVGTLAEGSLHAAAEAGIHAAPLPAAAEAAAPASPETTGLECGTQTEPQAPAACRAGGFKQGAKKGSGPREPGRVVGFVKAARRGKAGTVDKGGSREVGPASKARALGAAAAVAAAPATAVLSSPAQTAEADGHAAAAAAAATKPGAARGTDGHKPSASATAAAAAAAAATRPGVAGEAGGQPVATQQDGAAGKLGAGVEGEGVRTSNSSPAPASTAAGAPSPPPQPEASVPPMRLSLTAAGRGAGFTPLPPAAQQLARQQPQPQQQEPTLPREVQAQPPGLVPSSPPSPPPLLPTVQPPPAASPLPPPTTASAAALLPSHAHVMTLTSAAPLPPPASSPLLAAPPPTVDSHLGAIDPRTVAHSPTVDVVSPLSTSSSSGDGSCGRHGSSDAPAALLPNALAAVSATTPLPPPPLHLPLQGPVWEWAVLPDAPAIPVTTPDGQHLLLPALMLVHRGGAPSPPLTSSTPQPTPTPPTPLPSVVPQHTRAPSPSPLHHPHTQPASLPLYATAVAPPSPPLASPSPFPPPCAATPVEAVHATGLPVHQASPHTTPSPGHSPPDAAWAHTPSPQHHAAPRAAPTPATSPHTGPLPLAYSSLQPPPHYSHPGLPPQLSRSPPPPFPFHPPPSASTSPPFPAPPHALHHGLALSNGVPARHPAAPPGLPPAFIPKALRHSHPTSLDPTPGPRRSSKLGHAAAASTTPTASASSQPGELHVPPGSPRMTPPTAGALAYHNSRQEGPARAHAGQLHAGRAASTSSARAGGAAGAMTPRTHARIISRALVGSHPVNLELSDEDESGGEVCGMQFGTTPV